jgi:hypothetical protein
VAGIDVVAKELDGKDALEYALGDSASFLG